MKVTAVISEFNPFHKGHLLPLNYAKEKLKSDFTISIMSPDFVQRGEPAFFSKYERTKLALLAGYDAIINLSVLSAISSAEDFSEGAIKTIKNIGIVTDIVFGAETDDIELLEKISNILLNETSSFKEKLTAYLLKGFSYPKSLFSALKEEFLFKDEDIEFLKSPNSILAIEYIKAIKKYSLNISYHIIKRENGNYHENDLSLSAESIRKFILENEKLKLSEKNFLVNDKTLTELSSVFPKECFKEISYLIENNMYLSWNDFSSMLHLSIINYFFKTEPRNDIERRIYNLISKYKNPTDFIDIIKTKNRTYTNISRLMIRFLLSIDDDTFKRAKFKSDSFPYFIHILGFRKISSNLLDFIQEKSSVPIILNVKKDVENLNSLEKYNFSLEAYSNTIWKIALTQKINIEQHSIYSDHYPVIV